MSPADFDLLARLLRERSGLVVTPDKTYLLESRLLPVARRRGLASLAEVAAAIRGRGARELEREVVEAMTTNESFFFRDVRPFDLFRGAILPRLLKARAATRTIRIWSAACSSGQEPYSLSMILDQERARLAGWTVEILATDLSTEILDRAREGAYSQFEVQRGLPVQLMLKHFRQDGDRWRIDPALKAPIRFREWNLLDDPAPLGRFDVIFCRNVLIYFDQPTKARVLDRLSRLLPPDGCLLLGGAETVLGICDRLQPSTADRGLYVLAPAGGAAAA